MDIHASGYTAPIVELQLQYKSRCAINDTAVVETRYIATEAAKICFEYTIRSGTDGEIVAEGSSTQVFLAPAASCSCSRRSSTANGRRDGT